MGRKEFQEFLERKEKSGTLFYHTMAGDDICHKCAYRHYQTDYCRKFRTKIKRVYQRNGGFHHIPCMECLQYKLQLRDLNYMKLKYNRIHSKNRGES